MTRMFRFFLRVAAIACLALAAVWLWAPQSMLALWAVGGDTAAAGLVGRRGGALFLGVGVMFVLAQWTRPWNSAAVVTAGFGVACAALAVLGLWELSSGHAGRGILLAVAVEMVFTLACVPVVRAGRRVGMV